ncbi:MAG: lysine exporter LysO family protein [Desulfobacterales bacterium]|nr:lysine exporter LysO family protein [Desulfobacterales bacterium]MCP4160312.1 lysine exporter LysO family protein [Deltaproteobacteria bacterium]
MKSSLIILAFFVIGVFTGLFADFPSFLVNSDITMYIVYVLVFFVGVSIGSDNVMTVFKQVGLKIIIVPVCVVVGSLAGSAAISLFLNDVPIKEAMAIGSGFGYYSLSSIYITKLSGETFGTIALLSNLMREVLTILAAPLLVKYFGNLSLIASGGATSMDTTLPIVSIYSGKKYAIYALFNGVVLTILVPILVTFILT